jgi:uncharacterized lipoprotein YddW (UPF0748 family)
MSAERIHPVPRREFLKMGFMATVSAFAVSLSFEGCRGRKLRFKNWAWISAGSIPSLDDWKKIFLKMKENGVDGALVLAIPEKLKELIPLARETGIELQSWIISLECTDLDIKKNHPDWFMINRKGESSLEKPPYVPYYNWLCPSRPEVQAYLEARVANLCDLEGLAGVHLDYIRYPDVILPVGIQPKYNLIQDREFPEFDFCYCSVCRHLFKEKTGRDPLEIEDPAQDKEWIEFRYDSVTRLVNRLADVAHKKKKKLTAAVFPSPSIARKLVRQDWPNWHLDAFHPMMYHEYYREEVEWIGRVTREGVEALAGKAKLYSGLFVDWLPPEKLATAIRLVIGNGADGITLFTGTSLKEDQWKTLKETFEKI